MINDTFESFAETVTQLLEVTGPEKTKSRELAREMIKQGLRVYSAENRKALRAIKKELDGAATAQSTGTKGAKPISYKASDFLNGAAVSPSSPAAEDKSEGEEEPVKVSSTPFSEIDGMTDADVIERADGEENVGLYIESLKDVAGDIEPWDGKDRVSEVKRLLKLIEQKSVVTTSEEE